ncbi:MAG TPA: aromatic-ring-hydroxylating dioxygenase subunit beta [Stellaceae bacterium]|nr:aromatic-ring-hydroxylating dioxygenase subunit beta [Stellaceae bacterium]
MIFEDVARRLELERLYTDYADCLDGDRLESWPDFFTDDCRYRVTSAENYEAGLPLGIIYATSKDMLRDRVMALREANVYEPQRYRHLVSCLTVSPAGGGVAAVANVIVVRTMQDGAMSLFAVGRYIDRIVPAADGWKFAEKTVVLDSRRIDTLLAIPL